MLAMAEAQEALLNEGMTPTLLTELGKMLTEFDAASEAARAARLDRIGARADLEAVKVLDGINRWRFGKDPELLVAWNAARHVPGAGSRVSPRGPEGPVAGGESPPGSIAPAS